MQSTEFEYLSPAKKFMYDNAEFIADQLLFGEGKFIVSKDRYEEGLQSAIIREIMNLHEVEGAIPCEEGIMVFLF